MKFRKSFVTNSSSSAFIIDKNILTKDQLGMVLNHFEVMLEIEKTGLYNNVRYISNRLVEENKEDGYYVKKSDAYGIYVENDKVILFTAMDNIDMDWYLSEVVGISEEDIVEVDSLPFLLRRKKERDEN